MANRDVSLIYRVTFFRSLGSHFDFQALSGYDRKPELGFQVVIVYIRGAFLRNLFLAPGPLHFELCIP